MSERIRRLEQAYRASGEASDLLAWVWARQRAGLFELEVEPPEGEEESEETRLARWVEALAEGRLHPEQLELAAYLGDPLARLLDEERAVSLATYLGEGLELVPLVLGDAEDSAEAIARWILALEHWSASWVAEAQLAIAVEYVDRYETPEPDREDPYGDEGYYYLQGLEESWRQTLNEVRTYLDQGRPRPENFYPRGYCDTASVVGAALDLALNSAGRGWPSICLGPDPSQAPGIVREALLPRVLQTL